AEDGIRDGHVTGVQTCALPILPGTARPSTPRTACSVNSPGGQRRCAQQGPRTRTPGAEGGSAREGGCRPRVSDVGRLAGDGDQRSEERRVGKGCRGRVGREWGR